MTVISDKVKTFLERQNFIILSSLRNDGSIHTSAKGLIKVDARGKIFILDIYKSVTYRNIKRNPTVTVTSVDERRFRGYSLEGRGKIVREGSLTKEVVGKWHDKLAKRIAKRIISHVKEAHLAQESIPEAAFPAPKFLIEVSVDRIVDLAPGTDRKKQEG